MTDYGMFTKQGNAAVHQLVEQARELASLDGPVNPVQQACSWIMQELEALSELAGCEEATDTAVREAVHEAIIL